MLTISTGPREKTTVCLTLKRLYTRALARKNTDDISDIEEAFILAKKMNKRLVEYKYQLKLHDLPEDVKKELFGDLVIWEKELEDLRHATP